MKWTDKQAKAIDTRDRNLLVAAAAGSGKTAVLVERIKQLILDPLDKNPMPGHLSELQPVNEVNTKGQFFRASFGKNRRFQIQL